MPTILAYILTGIILGPLGLIDLQNKQALQSFGQLGITLLLFMMGLELKLRELASIGKTAVIGGTLQMVITFLCGYLLGIGLGFSSQNSLFIGIGVAFSSTIIIVKLLSDRKDLTSLHGKIAIGLLLVQDFFAILTIIFLRGISPQAGLSALVPQVGWLIIKIVLLFSVVLFLSSKVFPKILHILSRHSELLFLFSLSWVFFLAALVSSKQVGFSIEIGGFLAGLALANSQENFQIVAKMKTLRDFFITIFYVVLGINMTFTNISSIILPALFASYLVLLIKPLIVMGIVGFMGYRKRTTFLVGSSMAQISEFSLILMFLGNTLGYVSSEVVTLMLLVGIITFTGSSFFIQNSNKLYKVFSNHLDLFELRSNRKHGSTSPDAELLDMKNHIVIVGGHQMGQSIVRSLENDDEVIIVDFDPNIIEKLQEKEIKSLFGDIADVEIQERVKLDKTRLVISTVPDLEDNLLLIEGLRSANKKAKIIVMALESQDAKMLYQAGADYVVLPHLAGGRHLAKIIKDDLEHVETYKSKDLIYLN